MLQIKSKPEDFYVEEIPKNLDITRKKKDYTYFTLEKKNWNTREAIKAIASRLNTRVNRFNVAGVKDKKAITKQYVSAYNINENSLAGLKIKDLKIEVVGYSDERLKLGQLEYNKFRIVVRNLDREYDRIKFLENYFDDQRFGGRNHLLGESLAKKEFRKACYMLRLKWKTGDYVNPLRKLGKNLLRFYVNAYQSFLFNKALKEYLESKTKDNFKVDYTQGELLFSNKEIKNIKMPIVGFLTEFKDEEIKEIYGRILKKEKITKDNFLIREIPEIASAGNERNIIVKVKDLNVKYSKDESNQGKLKAEVEFKLPPGSYATLVIKKMFNQIE